MRLTKVFSASVIDPRISAKSDKSVDFNQHPFTQQNSKVRGTTENNQTLMRLSANPSNLPQMDYIKSFKNHPQPNTKEYELDDLQNISDFSNPLEDERGLNNIEAILLNKGVTSSPLAVKSKPVVFKKLHIKNDKYYKPLPNNDSSRPKVVGQKSQLKNLVKNQKNVGFSIQLNSLRNDEINIKSTETNRFISPAVTPKYRLRILSQDSKKDSLALAPTNVQKDIYSADGLTRSNGSNEIFTNCIKRIGTGGMASVGLVSSSALKLDGKTNKFKINTSKTDRMVNIDDKSISRNYESNGANNRSNMALGSGTLRMQNERIIKSLKLESPKITLLQKGISAKVLSRK